MITQVGADFRLAVHATAGAKREAVGGMHDDALRVAVTVAPDKGRANEAIVKALAAALELKPWQIKLHSGPTNRRKMFHITDAPPDIIKRVTALAKQA